MFAFFAILALLASAQAQCPGSGGVIANGQCWYIALFSSTNGCDDFCSSIGATADSNEIINVAGSVAPTTAGCQAVVDAFGFTAIVVDAAAAQCQSQGLGCFFNVGQSLRCVNPTTTTSATASFPGGGRFCACDAAASSGFTDPHFAGFNGEQLDIKHDDAASNKYFNIFCKENVAINALFSPNAEELLYMTEFNAKFGSFQFVMTLEKFVASGEFEIESTGKYTFADGSAVATANEVHVKYGAFTYNFISATEGEESYLDVYIQGPRNGQVANGIVGRSLTRAHSEEEFSQYIQFVRESATEFTCEL